jgi:hypothetical protein
MAIFKLQLGLTDVEESDNFVYDEIKEELHSPDLSRARYNILKQTDEDEKAVVEWKLNIDLPAVQHAIEYWEHTIRRPHLAMVQISSEKNHLLSTYFNIDVNLDFINLIPLSITPKSYTAEDLQNTFYPNNRRFGDLNLGYHMSYDIAGFMYEETSEYAIQNDTLEYYNPEAVPVAIPTFNVDFFLSRPSIKTNRMDFKTIKFLEKHKEEMETRGIDTELFLQKYGRLKAGTLLTESLEAYDNFTNYPRICRTSIVKEEE